MNTETINMPIDKGGRHMLTHRQVPYQTSIDTTISKNPLSSFYLCEPTSLTSPCLIQLRASFLENESLYLLETGGTEYISPVSGKLASIRLSTDSKLLLNKQTIEIENIKNTAIKKGDTLSFASPTGVPKNALIEILIFCPIVKDE